MSPNSCSTFSRKAQQMFEVLYKRSRSVLFLIRKKDKDANSSRFRLIRGTTQHVTGDFTASGTFLFSFRSCGKIIRYLTWPDQTTSQRRVLTFPEAIKTNESPAHTHTHYLFVHKIKPSVLRNGKKRSRLQLQN